MGAGGIRLPAEAGAGDGQHPEPVPLVPRVRPWDPIIFAVHGATGVKPPTYVADLSALVRGPEQALAVEVFLMAAGHAAGLRIDAHSCSSFHACSGIDAARNILGAMPVAVHAVGDRHPRGAYAEAAEAEVRRAVGGEQLD